MSKRSARRRGIALVLVLTVLFALVVIATPFVVSMVLQEETSVAQKEQRQADYGADGAKNYAAWRMMRGHDFMERRYPQIPWDTYHYDDHREIEARIADLVPTATARNPRGSIWGVTVQDEQGKINLHSTPNKLLGRIQASVDSRVLDFKDYLTLYSGRDARWVYPQRIRAIGTVQLSSGASVYGLQVDDATHYGRGARLRAFAYGRPPIEVEVVQNYVSLRAHVIETRPRIDGGYQGGLLELEARHPVNLNTAPRQVLAAIFEGLTILNNPGSAISLSQAQALAETFHHKSIQRLEDFVVRLASQNSLTAVQRIAVALNAINPDHALLDGSGTVPFTFRSGDVYTFEAFSSVNAPSGIETAARGFREVVSVVPPLVLTWALESQFDFDRYLGPVLMSAGRSGLISLNLYGYPFGGRILTFPNKAPTPSDLLLKAQQPPNREAVFRISPAQDNRGTAQLIATREHFDDTLEGRELQGGTLPYSWDRVFARYPRGASAPALMPDVAAGGVEFWIRFDRLDTTMTLFDVRQEDTRNRISLAYDVSTGVPELILTFADGTLGVSNVRIDNGTAQIRFPFVPTADKTWYHIGAYWKGTRYGHGLLLVDGFAHPAARFMHYSPEGDRLMTTLRTALTANATSWTLADTSMVPAGEASAWLVGGEVIEFDPNTSQLVRGARGTTAYAHPGGAAVQIFGYSSKLRNASVRVNFAQLGKPAAGTATMTFDRATTGGGRLTYGFGATPAATVQGDKSDPNNPTQTFVDDTQATIPVTSTDITQFPDQGHILIQNEVIYYTGRTGNQFTGCQRGAHGTQAAQHNTGVPVLMWGFASSTNANYLSPTVLQIDNEWFGPVYKDTDHPNHWIGHLQGTGPAIPAPFLRGPAVLGSTLGSHAANAEIIPTWAARESDLSVRRRNMGAGDRVTITDAQNQSLSMRIRRAGHEADGWRLSPRDVQLAGFETALPREYVADELHVRVLKFPSGELLGLNYLETVRPDFTIGPLQATIDEFKVFASPKGNFATGAAVGVQDAQLAMTNTAAISRTGGAVKVGDEVIAFAANQNNQLQRLTRGYLNSPAQIHDRGDLAFNLSFLPIAVVTEAVGPTASEVKITEGSAASSRRKFFNDPDGYAVLLSGGRQEVLMYTEAARNGDGTYSLRMPARWESRNGLFRGMFGTPALSHNPDTPVYFLPFRYWDTYKTRQFDNRMAYYHAATTMAEARWRTLTWTEEVPLDDRNLRTHVLVRIDDKGDWFDASDRRLLQFLGAGRTHRIDRTGFEGEAGQLELRVLFEYAGGFWPEHSWKRATRVKELRVEYDRPTRTLYHEDR